MRTAAGISAVAAFLAAIALLVLGDVQHSMRTLNEKVTSPQDTATLRAWKAGDGQDGRSPSPRDPAALRHDILGPSVQVNALGSVGGGTLLFSRDAHSYVVTACHVVQKILKTGDDEDTREPAEVTIYDEQGASTDGVEGDLVAWDERKDLALLRLRTVHELPNVARLASRESLRTVGVFTPIYAVGCPLGHDPLPTLGEIATLNKEVNGERFWMMNAPTIFGNSGGGVFDRETRELIGVSVMVCTYDGAVSTPVPHLGIMVSLESVYDWLDGLGYQFVYDPEFPLEALETVRSASHPAPPAGPEKPRLSNTSSGR